MSAAGARGLLADVRDTLAERLEGSGERSRGLLRGAARSALDAFAEYVVEESRLVVAASSARSAREAVDALADDTARLADRIDALIARARPR